MKKIILLFTVITGILSAKPCMTDIYFGNGVWNDKDDAEDNKNSLRKFMLFQAQANTRLNPNQEGIDYDFKYAHNPSYSYIEDLIETYWQLHQSGQIPYPFFYTISSILSQMTGNITENEIREKIGQAVSHYNDDVVAMLHTYQNESFSKHHNVLLVAHSQGNLWGNKMYTYFSDKEKKKFRMISVATPAAYVLNIGQTSPYVTASGDAVIGSIPNSLPGNVDGLGHEFVDTYLAGSINAPRRIASYVKAAYDELKAKATCNTYDYIYLNIYYQTATIQALGKISGIITPPINNLKYAIIQHGKDRCKKTNTKRVG